MALMVRCNPVMFGDHKYPGSGGVFLICHMVLKDHMMKGSRTLWVESLIVCHNPTIFGGHWHCRSGYIVFSLVEEEHSKC